MGRQYIFIKMGNIEGGVVEREISFGNIKFKVFWDIKMEVFSSYWVIRIQNMRVRFDFVDSGELMKFSEEWQDEKY